MSQTSDFNFITPRFPSRPYYPKGLLEMLDADMHAAIVEDMKRKGKDVDPHKPGAKLDQGKPRVGLVLGGFARALLEVSKVGTFGANKYTDNGWKEVENGEERYTDAMHRHVLAEAAGVLTDDESGLHHAAHAAWNALARLEFMLRDDF